MSKEHFNGNSRPIGPIILRLFPLAIIILMGSFLTFNSKPIEVYGRWGQKSFGFGMAFIAATSNSLWNVVLVVAFYNIPVYSKMVRSIVVPLKEIDYVLAAKVAGNKSPRIIFFHILPNALTPVFAQLPLSCAYAVQMIAGLSFLGLGVPIPMPEWGSMIQAGANYMVFGKWWLSIFPGLALFVSVWLLNMCSRMLQSLWERRE